MINRVGIIKRVTCIALVFLLSINSFAAIVSDNDGSAFITKSEFDALKSSFQSQIDSYNNSIDSKIDGAIASYLAGIKLSSEIEQKCILGENYKLPLRLCKSFFDVKDVLAAAEWGFNGNWSWCNSLTFKRSASSAAETDPSARVGAWIIRDPILTDFGVLETAAGNFVPANGIGLTFPVVGGSQGSYSTIKFEDNWYFDGTKPCYVNFESSFLTCLGRSKDFFKWAHKSDSGFVNKEDGTDTMVVTLGTSYPPHFLMTMLDQSATTQSPYTKYKNTPLFDSTHVYLAKLNWSTGSQAGYTFSFCESYNSTDWTGQSTIPRLPVTVAGSASDQLPCIATNDGFAPVPWASLKNKTLKEMVGTDDAAVAIQRNLFTGSEKNKPDGKYALCSNVTLFATSNDDRSPIKDLKNGFIKTNNTGSACIGTYACQKIKEATTGDTALDISRKLIKRSNGFDQYPYNGAKFVKIGNEGKCSFDLKFATNWSTYNVTDVLISKTPFTLTDITNKQTLSYSISGNPATLTPGTQYHLTLTDPLAKNDELWITWITNNDKNGGVLDNIENIIVQTQS